MAVVLYATSPFPRTGGTKNSEDAQQLGHTPRSNQEVKVMVKSKRGSTTNKGLFVKLLPGQKSFCVTA